MEPDIKAKKAAEREANNAAVEDREESVSSMEPMRFAEGSQHRASLSELAFQLGTHSIGFKNSLPAGVVSALSELVRTMNCYYSNLIEGHNTHPVDIERALQGDYSGDKKARDLQQEARAHVAVQQWIDEGGLDGRVITAEGICEIHRRFYEQLPDELCWVEDPESGERQRVEPGALRTRDVQVGKHVAISPGAVPRFLGRFEEAYGNLGNQESIVSAAAAHHRLLWIHPFMDGNGRVVRLLSYAMLRQAMETGGLWSVARGLARQNDRYKTHLMACDQTRQGVTDGRGARSERAMADFSAFFLESCIDQVRFMEELVQPGRLRERIRLWVEEEIRVEALPQHAGNVLDAILYRGELPRGEVPVIVGKGDRQARRIVSALQEAGVVTSASTRAPLKIAFPARLAERWMPGLFPGK